MAAADTHRSGERNAQVIFRVSKDERETIKRRAAERGMSVQSYLEHVALGYESPIVRPGGRPFKTQQELPLTG